MILLKLSVSFVAIGFRCIQMLLGQLADTAVGWKHVSLSHALAAIHVFLLGSKSYPCCLNGALPFTQLFSSELGLRTAWKRFGDALNIKGAEAIDQQNELPAHLSLEPCLSSGTRRRRSKTPSQCAWLSLVRTSLNHEPKQSLRTARTGL